MGYYVRAFCKSNRVPTIDDALKWISKRGFDISIDDEEKTKLNSADWKQISLYYKKGKLPIVVECNRDDGTEECMLRQEIKEFLEFIGKPGLSFGKRMVINHLKNTRYVICCQLLTSDIDDDGYNVNGEFLKYFVENYGGIIQADGEGFYKGNKIVVKLK